MDEIYGRSLCPVITIYSNTVSDYVFQKITRYSQTADFARNAQLTLSILVVFIIEQNLVEISAVMLLVFCRHLGGIHMMH